MKGVLLSEDARAAHERSEPLSLEERDGRIEQQPDEWMRALCAIVRKWRDAGVAAEDIRLVAFCGQMQDLIPVDDSGRPVGPAILYSDGRAEAEAEELISRVGRERIADITANPFNGTQPLAKLLWMKRREPERYARVARAFISAKDYVVALLTGAAVTDPTSASTAGCMDMRSMDWSDELLAASETPRGLLPRIAWPGEVVGAVRDEAARLTGLAEGTPVLCGIGDAGATTLGAGVYSEDRSYIYLGTTGWTATVSRTCGSTALGAFNLAYFEPGAYVGIAPLLNAGNVYRWGASAFAGQPGAGRNSAGQDAAAEPDFEAFERLARQGLAEPNPLLFLPYLHGERYPVQDLAASGCLVGLKPSTTRSQMAAAVLEGTALAIRQVIETLSDRRAQGEIVVIGGGTRSPAWCGALADALQARIRTPARSEFLPAVAAGALGFPALSWGGASESMERHLARLEFLSYVPDEGKRTYYDEKFRTYEKLYPALASVWSEG